MGQKSNFITLRQENQNKISSNCIHREAWLVRMKILFFRASLRLKSKKQIKIENETTGNGFV